MRRHTCHSTGRIQPPGLGTVHALQEFDCGDLKPRRVVKLLVMFYQLDPLGLTFKSLHVAVPRNHASRRLGEGDSAQ